MNVGIAHPFVALILLVTVLLAIRAARPSSGASRSLMSELPLALLPASLGLSGAMLNHLAELNLVVQLGSAITPHDRMPAEAAVVHVLLLGIGASVILIGVGLVFGRRPAT